MNKYLVAVISLINFVPSVHARSCAAALTLEPAGIWLATESEKAVIEIDRNISRVNTPEEDKEGLIRAAPGAIIAARTRKDPNYYYHWVRDAGIVVDAYLSAVSRAEPSKDRSILKTKAPGLQKIYEYVDFSRRVQNLPYAGQATTGLGEPKYEVDATQFKDGWGRPQNDGVALRTISLVHFAQILKAQGQEEYIRSHLYRAELPATTAIKMDLEFLSHHWRDPSYDIWEEVKGDHFYTRMVQRRALLEGAKLARSLGDGGAADWYDLQAREIKKSLDAFWDSDRAYFVATLNRVDGLDYKNSQLDTAVILGLLHGDSANTYIPFSDPRVLATIERLIKSFGALYPVNQVSGRPGTAIGRYPEDRYAGRDFSGGNPWPLTTLAVAEAAYQAAAEFRQSGDAVRAAHWFNIGEDLVLRVKFHAPADGSLNEQIDRNSGYMTSVRDLTWNYAAVLTTTVSRRRAKNLR